MKLRDTNADSLAVQLMSAIRTPEVWANVLDTIIEQTPACAAIITLRDKKNCQIVIDDHLVQKYHSPLIRGFSLEAVGYYLTELRTIDPWAEVQRTHYPHRPTIMSRVCPKAQYPGHRFFEWLADLQMQDTVVFELDRMAGYWTACNFFLPTNDPEQAEELRAFADAHFTMLRNAWKSSQVLQHSQQLGTALLDQVGDVGRACCLVGANGELWEGNGGFDELCARDVVRVSGPDRKVSLAKNLIVSGLDAWEDHDLIRHSAVDEQFWLTAKPVDPDPRFIGKRESLWVLVFATAEDQKADQANATEAGLLTTQEERLYHGVLRGLSVRDAGEEAGLRRSRAFEVWASVKAKLDIDSAHQIRRRYG